MSNNLRITVNGRRHRVEAVPDTPLLYVLRNELGLSQVRLRLSAVRGL